MMNLRMMMRSMLPIRQCHHLCHKHNHQALTQYCSTIHYNNNLHMHNFCQKRYASFLKGIESGHEAKKTTATILNDESDGIIMIDGISEIGFLLNNGMNVFGSIALFPRSILSWNVKSVSEITPESLSLFTILEPKLDILIIGTGNKGTLVNKDVIVYLRKKKIPFEILSTENALATYNFLADERRYVAGVFLPATDFKISMENLINARMGKEDAFLMPITKDD